MTNAFNAFNAIKITDKVYWVGAVDWGVRDFHGYMTKRGTTYNAYLIMGDKITLIDTVKKEFREEMMNRIKSVTDPADISYIVSNHAELDHSGALPAVIAEIKPEKVFTSKRGQKALEAHFRGGLELTAVKTGEDLDLGGLTLSFIETPMLHWPDSMFSYLAEEKLLFSQDAFGMHLATSERFCDEVPESVIREETEKYYANILLPFSPLVLKLVEQVKTNGPEVSIIASDHGPIWRRNCGDIISRYSEWAQMKPVKKAVIVFDTMWGSTAQMAKAIAEGVVSEGISTKLLPLSGTHRSEVAHELLSAGAFIVGSPTINNQIFPTVADILCYIKGLKRRNLIGGVFGSFGWSGESVGLLKSALQEMEVEVVGEVKNNYAPDAECPAACYELGRKIAIRLKELTSED